MEFDPFLYVAFGAGLLAGWALRPRSPWLGRATLASVGVLVALLGASLSGLPVSGVVAAIPLAFGFVGLVLGLTILLYVVLARSAHLPAPPPRTGSPPPPAPVSLALLAALLGGYALGRSVSFPAATLLPFALYVLLFLVGFGIELHARGLRTLWLPLAAAVPAAVLGGVLYALATGTALSISLSIGLGFGWYSLAGPLVLARAGAFLGLVAFLANFLREDLTMLLSPLLGRRLRGEGLSAMGGATSMDTTLYFITRFGDPDSGTIALATGLVLTVAASLVLPLLLSLPG